MADGQTFTLDDVVAHPEFQSMSLQDKNGFLMEHVPEFAKGAPKDRSDLLNHIHYSGDRAPTVPSTEPGETESPAIGRELALGALGTVAPESEHPIADLAKSLVPSAKDIGLTALTAGVYPIAKAGLGLAQNIYGAGKEIAPIIPKMVPGGGGSQPISAGEAERAAHGVGTIAGLAGMAIAPKVIEGAPSAIRRAWGDPIGTPAVPPGMSDAAAIRLASPEARTGVVKIAKTAAPSPGNVDFMEKAAIAAPDLAEIERAHPLSQSGSKGGIIRPDYRVRQTVANIDDHLDTLWNKDRTPLIERNGTAPVDTIPELSDLSQDTLKGVSRKMRGQLPPTDRTLTLGQTDDLLHGVNAYLRSIEGKTPEAQALARATNPQIDALYSLKGSLRQAIGKTLERQGVPRGTLDDFDMRYGALSEVRDQLRTQMNPVEAERFIDRLVGYAGLKGLGLKGIKTVEVSPGRTLQKGMESLAKSSLSPEVERTARQMQIPPRPALPPAPESAVFEPAARIIGGTTPANAQVEEAYPVRPGVERLGTGLRAPEQIPIGPSAIGGPKLLTEGGAIRMPPSPLQPVGGSMPTGGLGGFPETMGPQPPVRFGGTVRGVGPAAEPIRTGKFQLPAGEGVGPVIPKQGGTRLYNEGAKASRIEGIPVIGGSEPTPTGGLRGFQTAAQPDIPFGGSVRGIPAEYPLVEFQGQYAGQESPGRGPIVNALPQRLLQGGNPGIEQPLSSTPQSMTISPRGEIPRATEPPSKPTEPAPAAPKPSPIASAKIENPVEIKPLPQSEARKPSPEPAGPPPAGGEAKEAANVEPKAETKPVVASEPEAQKGAGESTANPEKIPSSQGNKPGLVVTGLNSMLSKIDKMPAPTYEDIESIVNNAPEEGSDDPVYRQYVQREHALDLAQGSIDRAWRRGKISQGEYHNLYEELNRLYLPTRYLSEEFINQSLKKIEDDGRK